MKMHDSNQYDLPWSIIWLSGTGKMTHKNTWIEKSEKSQIFYSEYENMTRKTTELPLDFGLERTQFNVFMTRWCIQKWDVILKVDWQRIELKNQEGFFSLMFFIYDMYDWRYLYFRVQWNWWKAYVLSYIKSCILRIPASKLQQLNLYNIFRNTTGRESTLLDW